MGRETSGTANGSRRDRLIWGLQLGAVLLGVWLALTGFSALALGIAVAAAGGLGGALLVPVQPYPWRPHRLVAFFAYFLHESWRGGVDVAWRALDPRMPLEPHWCRYRMRLPEGQPRTLMTSVVSLLPGTLSADLLDDDLLLVHALSGDVQPALERLEQRVHWLFSLSAGPGR